MYTDDADGVRNAAKYEMSIVLLAEVWVRCIVFFTIFIIIYKGVMERGYDTATTISFCAVPKQF